MHDQLVLTEDTLRVTGALVPYGRVLDAVTRARNSYDGGHITVDEIEQLETVLAGAAADDHCIITPDALAEATAQLHQAASTLDLRMLRTHRHLVSVFAWDPWRDGPMPVLTRRIEIAIR